MSIKWFCPMCGSRYEDDLAKELFYSCCVDTKLLPHDKIEQDKNERMEVIDLDNTASFYSRLESYILERYDNWKNIGCFHIEYSHARGELHLEVFGVKITKTHFLHKIDRILDGIYDLWQKEEEPYEGSLYELMLDFEILKEAICL